MAYKITHQGTPFAPLAGGAARHGSVLVPLPHHITLLPGEKVCLDTGIIFDWPTKVYGRLKLCQHLMTSPSNDLGLFIDNDEPIRGE